jgi:hypothetical protein
MCLAAGDEQQLLRVAESAAARLHIKRADVLQACEQAAQQLLQTGRQLQQEQQQQQRALDLDHVHQSQQQLQLSPAPPLPTPMQQQQQQQQQQEQRKHVRQLTSSNQTPR